MAVIRGLSEGIIVVVGDGEANKMAKALFEGADAYLQYPIDRPGLLSRLQSLLRRQGTNRQAHNDRSLFTRTQEQVIQAYLAALSPIEKQLFNTLLTKTGRVILVDQLVSDVWGRSGTGNSLRFYIQRLRKKLEPCGFLKIFNQKGIGYRLEYQQSQGLRDGI